MAGAWTESGRSGGMKEVSTTCEKDGALAEGWVAGRAPPIPRTQGDLPADQAGASGAEHREAAIFGIAAGIDDVGAPGRSVDAEGAEPPGPAEEGGAKEATDVRGRVVGRSGPRGKGASAEEAKGAAKASLARTNGEVAWEPWLSRGTTVAAGGASREAAGAREPSPRAGEAENRVPFWV